MSSFRAMATRVAYDLSSNRHPALSFCLSMISGQTLRVCPEGKPVPTFPDHALAQAGVDLVERSGARTQRFLAELVERRVHRVEVAVQVFRLRIDVEQAGHDLALG